RKRTEHQNQLNDLLEGEPTEAADSRKVACALLKRFAQEFEAQNGEKFLFSECERNLDEFEQSIRQLTEPNEDNDELLKQVKEEFKDQRGCEFKQVANVFPVLRRIVKNLVNDKFWPLTMGVFEKICTAVTDYMDQLADVNFGKYPPFRDYMKERLTKKTTTIKTDARKWLENVLKMEATCVQTRNRQFNRVGQTPPAPRESFSSEDLPDHEEDGEHSAADDIPQSFRQSMDENELLIYVLLTKYLLILADQTVDNVAKTIQY
uniref:Dynamin_M domain-containing protein n=1 Tax=Macrostomum lignano TaxID=282301 RepID=A0A1I8IDB0_9PLAT